MGANDDDFEADYYDEQCATPLPTSLPPSLTLSQTYT